MMATSEETLANELRLIRLRFSDLLQALNGSLKTDKKLLMEGVNPDDLLKIISQIKMAKLATLGVFLETIEKHRINDFRPEETE